MMDFKPTQAIYLQIADMLRSGIASGTYPEKERFPSVREMATELGVNPNTVMRAYDRLQSESIITMSRGVGYFVCEDALQMILKQQREEFFAATLPEFLATIDRLEIDREQIAAEIKN